jgi:TetR/AcrR family transcriptional regulator, cholesterol catabolism regulator
LKTDRKAKNKMITHNNQRDKILKVAASLFISNGYAKTTIREIARKSGMSTGALYYYVKSKEDILILFQERELSLIRDGITKEDEIIRTTNPVIALRKTFKIYMQIVDELQDVILFWQQHTKFLPDKLRQELLEHEELIVEIFKKIIIAGCESGDFKVKNVDIAAHTIIVIADMWAYRRWFLAKHFNSRQFMAHQVEFIISALRNGSDLNIKA